jgi:hypothetical protein
MKTELQILMEESGLQQSTIEQSYTWALRAMTRHTAQYKLHCGCFGHDRPVEGAVFKSGDKARVCSNAGEHRDDFLKHALKIGREVEIAGVCQGWKRKQGELGYLIKGSSEILLASELEKI